MPRKWIVVLICAGLKNETCTLDTGDRIFQNIPLPWEEETFEEIRKRMSQTSTILRQKP